MLLRFVVFAVNLALSSRRLELRRLRIVGVASAAALVLAAGAAAHDLDHVAPQFQPAAPVGTGVNSGGPGANWKLLTTFPTGNPHTDLDFFTQGGETYASVGTLAAGPNGGGQTIVQLTNRGSVDPRFVSSHPSASCISRPDAALGLQHDVEATPKGGTLLNTADATAVGGDAQLLVDATDQRGRCHDQGIAGIQNAPRGGLELVDITNVLRPVEIGLTSHVGESHTVNIDPKRPHIAYSVTSDSVSVVGTQRQNEVPGSGDRFDLDGFEVVDMSSCMNFPKLANVELRRMMCRPQVYRYRFPSTFVSLGHTTKDAVYGCHELEVYPDDTLTCGSGAAAIVFDVSGAFDENGKPRGTPLPCAVRPSSTVGPTATRAMVTDCVVGQNGQNLDIPSWIASGAPSLQGVEYVGSIHHQGRGGPFPSTEDNDFNHETELSASGDFLIATDERGGGVSPPGATCAIGVDNPMGNGGVQFYKRSALRNSLTSVPTQAEAWQAYARTPGGGKAIYRATPRTGVEPTVCTAHVFQQIPGQNRIFMGWYSQGTQVVDFVERADGTVELKEAGWFIPEEANTWTSHVFKMRENGDGSFTYWGATGDFFLSSGRSAIDVYEVTLPAPPRPGGETPTERVCVEDDDPTIAYSNGWHRQSDIDASDGHFAFNTGKDTAHSTGFTFTGDGTLTYDYATSSKGGTADVFIDGVKQETVSYAGTAKSARDPQFGAARNYAVTGSGEHVFELRNLRDVTYVDRFCLERATPSTTAAATGPGATTNGSGSLGGSQELTRSVTVPAGARQISVVAESSLGLPIRLAVVDPSGTAVGTSDASTGLAVVERPVSQSGVYLVKVLNLGVGPVEVWTAATPWGSR